MPLIPVKGQPIPLSSSTPLVDKSGVATVPFWNWLARLTSGIVTISGTGIASSVTPVVDGQAVVYDGVTGQLVKPSTATGVAKLATGVLSAGLVDLSSEVSNDLPYANLTPASVASRLLGRGSASGGGDWQEITPGTGLSMSGTTLNATATGDVTHTGTLTANRLILGNGGADITAASSLGTTTTLLHGNAAGAPSFATVVEADITLANNTTNNVTTAKHGFAPILPNVATLYLDGTGAYSTPTGTGGSGTVTNTGAMTAGKLIVGNGGVDVTASSLTATVVKASSGTPSAATDGTDYVSPTTQRIIQIVNTQTGAVASGTGIIPYDDTIPQITEGDEYMTLAVTPTSATNNLRIDVVIWLSPSVARFETAALFQDATSNALAAMAAYMGSPNGNVSIAFSHYMTAGTTSATTFRVRGGGDTAVTTTTFNGQSAGRKLGGVSASSITITEIHS